MTSVDALVLGASGYVGGEVLRLLLQHPVLKLRAACSRSAAGAPIEETFTHLPPGTGTFVAPGAALDLLPGKSPMAVFSCLPHGEAAGVLDDVLRAAASAGRELALVDLSADFRHADAGTYAKIYDQPHGAPERLPAFTCALPDLPGPTPSGPVAHPGCFTTAVTLAAAPLLAAGLVEPRVFVSAVTGSTGSGRTPSAATHHPRRHGNLVAYKPLQHRHAPEMEALLGRCADRPVTVAFVPHSGPFARGIHATLQLTPRPGTSLDEHVAAVRTCYAASPFIAASTTPPSLKDVVGSNRCHLGLALHDDTLVVLSVIDNLVKGAAGGAVQWMNRLLDLPPSTGLLHPALGW